MSCYFPQKQQSDPIFQTHVQSVWVYEYGEGIREKSKVTKVVNAAADYRTNWWGHLAGVRVVCSINLYTINTKEKEYKTNEQAD
jgi:hypothetical protein